jgi:hypothetical protein
MVQFIQRGPSFGEQIGQSVGGALSKFSDMMTQLNLEKLKQKQLQDLITPKQSDSQKDFSSSMSQQEGTPYTSKKSLWSSLSPQQQTALNILKPEVARNLMQEDANNLKRERFEHQKDVEQEGVISRSYESQKPFIDKTTASYRTFESDTKPKLMQLQELNKEELIAPSSAKFLEVTGIPLGVLENPSNELYDKVSQDLLKGLPETYGNKILLAEVQNFLKTIPRLVNSSEGRRMIASNMLKLGEMKEVLYNEMRRQQTDLIDRNQKFPRDFEQRVFDNVKPQIDRINKEFAQMAQIKSIPPNTTPYFNPQGGISFVPNDPKQIAWAEQNGGRKIW